MARTPQLQEIEAAPEADRLDGFPHPRETLRLVGHGAAQRTVLQAFEAGRVHHAWLLTGREGVGKATLAYGIARYALARPEERAVATLGVPTGSVAARQVTALSHPGLLVLRRPWDGKAKRFTASIPVDEVRRLKTFLAHSAAPGAWRVVIVDQADELNLNAANALLKSLEEPPANALFLLVSSEPGRLLTTIRSRCRRLELAPLAAGELREAATAALAAGGLEPPPEAQWPGLTAISQGSVRRMLALSRSEGLGLYAKVQGLLALLPKVDWPQVHALADELTGAGTEQRFEQFYELLLDQLARLVRARALGAAGGEQDRLAERLIGAQSLATWAELWETVGAKKAETQALNLDRRSLILDTVARLQAAARG